jgi:hypothetical protein
MPRLSTLMDAAIGTRHAGAYPARGALRLWRSLPLKLAGFHFGSLTRVPVRLMSREVRSPDVTLTREAFSADEERTQFFHRSGTGWNDSIDLFYSQRLIPAHPLV